MPTIINGANRVDLHCDGTPVWQVVSEFREVLNFRWDASVLIFANRQLVCLKYPIRPDDLIEFVRIRGWKGGGVPDGTPSWITAELLDETIRVWQRFYEVPLTKGDALVILLNASELLEVVEEGEKDEEVCHIRTRQ